jgi:hypothetical protein
VKRRPGKGYLRGVRLCDRMRDEIRRDSLERRESARRPVSPLPDLGLWEPDQRLVRVGQANPDSTAAFLDSPGRR